MSIKVMVKKSNVATWKMLASVLYEKIKTLYVH